MFNYSSAEGCKQETNFYWWSQKKGEGTRLQSMCHAGVKRTKGSNKMGLFATTSGLETGSCLNSCMALIPLPRTPVDELGFVALKTSGNKKSISNVFAAAFEGAEIKTTLPLLISITRWLLINCSDGIMICCQMFEEWAMVARVDFLPFLIFLFFPLFLLGSVDISSQDKDNAR